MLEMNKVMVIGRLTRDPETRYLPSGSAVANFDIAVNRRYRDSRSNEYVDETSFFSVKAWNKQAEFVQKYFPKGKAIFVEGRLQQETWEREGQKRSRVVINAERLSFVESRSEEQNRGYNRPEANGYSQPAPAPAQQPTNRASSYDKGSDMPPMPGQGAQPGNAGTDDDLPF